MLDACHRKTFRASAAFFAFSIRRQRQKTSTCPRIIFIHSPVTCVVAMP